jgi:cell division protease FtsH
MFLPEGFTPTKTYSEKKAAQIDDEVTRVIDEAHQRVRGILSGHRKVLDELAHLLSREEVVEGEELRKMLSESKPGMPTTLPEQTS